MLSNAVWPVFLSISFVKCQVAYEDSYYDDYNYDDKDHNDSNPEEVLPTPSNQAPEFRANVTCSANRMMLEIDRSFLPTGIGFAGSISEDVIKSGNFDKIPCIRVTHDETHYIYKVALRCHRAVGKLDYGSSIIYTHELDLEDIRMGISRKKKTYSVIIDCETSSKVGNDKAFQTWRPNYRLFEHRENEACAMDSCSLKELCLPSKNITGYFCSCPSLQNGCSCPRDFYACETPSNVSDNIICIRNEQLCDGKHDCPLQDDEECGNVWTQWSAWSTCSVSCSKGTQTRQRSCTHSFKQNPSLFQKECVKERASSTDSRICEQSLCSTVKCGANEMIIEIPLEAGMNKKSVEERMHLADIEDDEDCKPKLNSSHALFAIPLHKCNTAKLVEGDIVSYTNVVMYEVEDQDSIILREYAHSYTAKCVYKRRQTVSMRRIDGKAGKEFSELAVLKYTQKSSSSMRDANKLDAITHYSSGDGAFEYAMYIYDDSSYTRPYEDADYPLEKKLGERIYIAVDFLSQDEDLHVFIERCWATSSNASVEYTDEELIYVFITGGCAIDSTVRFHNTLNTQFSDRYSIESFKFNDEQHRYIYFRCDVILCDASENDPACRRECNSRSTRRKRQTYNAKRSYARVIQGPIVVFEKEDVTNSLWNSGISVGSVEHKILTYDDVQRKSSGKEYDRTEASIFESSYFVAAIVGCVCLLVGVTLGLVARNKKKSTMFSDKKVRHNRENDETGKQVAESDTLIEAQKQS